MPEISSILKIGKSNDFSSYGCCQFLHSIGNNTEITAYVPLKHFYNPKDTSEKFSKWIEFLQEIGADVSLDIVEEDTYGIFTFDEVKNLSDYEMSRSLKFGQKKYSSNHSRVRRTRIKLNEYGDYSPYIFVYGNLSSCDKRTAIRYVENVGLKRKIPVAYVKIYNKDLPPPMVYWTWATIRTYLCYQEIGNWILDNKDTNLLTLKERYGLTWYDILNAVFGLYRLDSIFNILSVGNSMKDLCKAVRDRKKQLGRNTSYQSFYFNQLSLKRGGHHEARIDQNFNLKPHKLLFVEVNSTVSGKMKKADSEKLEQVLVTYIQALCTHTQ